jgi:hypothetical protein
MKSVSARLAVLAIALVATACGSTRPADGAVKPYPLDTCLVMDAPLGSMGDPIVKVYGDQEVKFCCQPCVAEFESNQAAYLAKLEEAQRD